MSRCASRSRGSGQSSCSSPCTLTGCRSAGAGSHSPARPPSLSLGVSEREAPTWLPGSVMCSLWFCLHRTWRTNLPKGACALLLTSVDHDRAPVVGVRVNVLLSRYLMEPCGSGKSRLTYMCRADLRYVLPRVFLTRRGGHEEDRLSAWCRERLT